uniref:Ovule protein n=1 Tax=Mesocestoides corti TaxID=53468 RepID=A0A5K3EQ65_MESCO
MNSCCWTSPQTRFVHRLSCILYARWLVVRGPRFFPDRLIYENWVQLPRFPLDRLLFLFYIFTSLRGAILSGFCTHQNRFLHSLDSCSF